MGAIPRAATEAPPQPDREAVAAFAAGLMDPGQVYEVRLPKTKKGGPRRLFGIGSGYFDNPEDLARVAAGITGADAEAVCMTLNPVKPDLIARAVNRLKDASPATTSDDQILRRRKFLVDVDPAYDSGLSATADERRAALTRRNEIREFLRDQLGWPDPWYAGSSGNGGTLIFRIDEPNDEATREIIAACLSALDGLFGDDRAKLDTTTSNASRICKVAGTVAAKGDHTDLRPWRLARGEVDPAAGSVSRRQLEALAALAPQPEPKQARSGSPGVSACGRSWRVGDVLRDSGVDFHEKQRAGSAIYVLDRCLTSQDHTDGACIIERPDGMLLYVCHHDRCQGKTWHDAKGALKVPERPEPTSAQADAATHEPAPSVKVGSGPNGTSPNGTHAEAAAAAARLVLGDFASYLPERKYIYLPTGKIWEPAGLNRAFPAPKDAPKSSDLVDDACPVHDLTWAPGEPQIIKGRFLDQGGWIEKPGARTYNGFRPPRRMAGEAAASWPWTEHVARLYPDDADHILDWLAHRVQRPGEKLNHALVLGGMPGIGKDTILQPVHDAIGPWNFGDVSPIELMGRFNAFLKSVILRVSELRDLGDRDRFGFYEHTKTLIAAPPDTVLIDEKNVRAYRTLNVVGVIFTTNHRSDGLYLPADDRRHYVAWSDCTAEDFDADYWPTLYEWFASDGAGGSGSGHVAAFLRERDLSGFDPKAPPPKTPAFWDVVSSGRAREDDDLADALEALKQPEAVTVGDIEQASADMDFKAWLRDRRNSRLFPHRFEAAGYVAVQNPGATDKRWKVGGKNVVIYARRTLPIQQRIEAARKRAGRPW